MLVRCWGSRGSVPVSGKEYMKYGGDTTCIEVVSASGEILIIDAGTGIRKLGNRLQREGLKDINIVLTHPHWDHLSGFPFFKPLYTKECRINVWGPLTTRESLKSLISKTMSPPHFPIQLKDILADIRFLGIEENDFRIGPFGIKTITISHPNQGTGYRIEEDGKSFVFLTDNEPAHDHNSGLTTGDYIKFAKGADLLFHDAEYTPEEYEHTRGWGHSLYLDTLELAIEAGVKTLGLFHHNQDRDDRGVDKLEKECQRLLKEKGSKMKCFAVAEGSETTI